MAFFFWKIFEFVAYYLGITNTNITTEEMPKSTRSHTTSPTNTDSSEGSTDPDASLSVILDSDMVPVWTEQDQAREEERVDEMRRRASKVKKPSPSRSDSAASEGSKKGTSTSRSLTPRPSSAAPGPSSTRPHRTLSIKKKSNPRTPPTSALLPIRSSPLAPTTTPPERPPISAPIPITALRTATIPIPSYLSTLQKHKFTGQITLQHLRYTHTYLPLPHQKPDYPPNPLALRHLKHAKRCLLMSTEYTARTAGYASTMGKREKGGEKCMRNMLKTFFTGGTADEEGGNLKGEEGEREKWSWVWVWDMEVLDLKERIEERTEEIKRMRTKEREKGRVVQEMAESCYIKGSEKRRRERLEKWEEKLGVRWSEKNPAQLSRDGREEVEGEVQRNDSTRQDQAQHQDQQSTHTTTALPLRPKLLGAPSMDPASGVEAKHATAVRLTRPSGRASLYMIQRASRSQDTIVPQDLEVEAEVRFRRSV